MRFLAAAVIFLAMGGPAPVAFVGAEVCASCHPKEAALWSGSHHQRAMQRADATTVLGDFADAQFGASRFFRREGDFVARVDGQDHRVAYTFGVEPLQQYLVPFPGGRFQGLEIAWDTAGKHWFHLGEPGWTGAAENWNFMCADCHSTHVKKSWDGEKYSTTFAEISVSCEACHGPGSRHTAAPRREKLALGRDEHTWARGDKPARSRPPTSAAELEMCARCHSRRSLLHEDSVHGQPVGDDYRVALLEDDLYWPDGQMKGEVYEYGSFLQSKMHAAGVTCSDCHDPHKPELAGSDVCGKCHADRYFTSAHHHHGDPSPGCVACHMPAATYMVIDERHDHSLRVPRPDLSVKLGVPNACNACHADRSPSWAAAAVEKWLGRPASGLQQFAEALATNDPSLLAALIADRGQPAIARATALSRAPELAEIAWQDEDPLVRRAAAQDPRFAARLLEDPVRSVRLQAAATMGGAPSTPALEKATRELVAAEELAGDRPEGHLNLANLYTKQRLLDRAEAELRRALAIDPDFVPATVNLADLYRATDRDAEPLLRQALQRTPQNPPLLHALGLALVRKQRLDDAIDFLGAAARLGRGDARLGFVYAVALHDLGRKRDALRELEEVLRRHPRDRDAQAALASFRHDRW